VSLPGPALMSTTPSGKFLYVVSTSSKAIYGFSIDPNLGTLTPLSNSPISTDAEPNDVAVDPSGRFLYVTEYPGNVVSSGSVLAFAIDSSGNLSAISGSPFASGPNPGAVTVDPTGQFLYVATSTSTSQVWAYTIDPATGALSAISGSPYPAGQNSSSVAVDPSGQALFVSNEVSSNIAVYEIDNFSGQLVHEAQPPVASGTYPIWLGVDPYGSFLYVTGEGSPHGIFGFSVGPFGISTALTNSPFFTNEDPGFIALDPSGRFAYVTNSDNTVAVYKIDRPSGALSQLIGSQPTGAGPNQVVVVGTFH
jgi:6-phosphogluconolactonase (cycloisomerase 2 family)